MLERITKAKEYIKSKTDFVPQVVIVLGSGLSGYSDNLDVVCEFDYAQIPGFPISTAPSHKGKLYFAKKDNKNIAVLAGRFHCYEGYNAEETVIPLRTLIMIGAKTVLLTNAAGGINKAFSAGDLMIITDHINFSGINVLKGKNMEDFGVRFPDMSYAYSPKLNGLLKEVANTQGIPLKEGIYAYMVGPSYETPAEIRGLRALGADAVGMSTVHEVVACSHANIDVCALSCISNLAAGVTKEKLTIEEIFEAGKKVAGKMTLLVDEFIAKL